jgi:hypothetical protein
MNPSKFMTSVRGWRVATIPASLVQSAISWKGTNNAETTIEA